MNLSFRTLFGGGLLLIGTVILLIAGDQILTERRYASSGEEIDGVVLKKDLRRATSDSSSSYEITYRITPTDNDPVERTESVEVATWERLETGSRVRVRHLPGDAKSARIEAPRDVLGAAIAAAVGVVLWAVAMGLFVSGRDKHSRATAVRRRSPRRREPAPIASGIRIPKRLTQSFGVWFGSIWLIAGLPFLGVTISLFYDDWRYETEGRTTQGTVLTKEVRRSRSSNSNGYTTSHYVTYRFAGPQGGTVEGRDQLDQSQWSALTERGPIQIVYLPSSIASHRVVGQTSLLLKVIFGILGSAFTLMGAAILFLAVRRVWSESGMDR